MSATQEQALLAALAASHAAVFGYGVLGGRLDVRTRQEALRADDAHRARRDSLMTELRTRSVVPPAPPASYDVAVAHVEEALALAVRLEVGVGQRWRDLVAATDERALRQLGLAGLTETAVRAAEWRRRQSVLLPTVALPGA